MLFKSSEFGSLQQVFDDIRSRVSSLRRSMTADELSDVAAKNSPNSQLGTVYMDESRLRFDV